MHNPANHYLVDTMQQESYLPEVDAESCVYSQFSKANCRGCVESCPSQAWVLDDDSLGLNTAACDGCGQCIPSCPTGALHVDFPWVVRQFSEHSMALFCCVQSQVNIDTDRLPCIHIIGLRQLLLIYNSGIKYLLVSTGNCSSCDHDQQSDLSTQLKHLNQLLLERNKPAMKIIHRSHKVWKMIFKTGEIISHGIKLSRREFLQGKGQHYRQQMLLQDPLNLPECRTVPPGQLLPKTEKKELNWPWSPLLDTDLCNGCDACMNLCPTQALAFIPAIDNSSPVYRINPANCNGCGICEDVCESNAITINRYSKVSNQIIKQTEQDCTSCGNRFHLPQNNSLSEKHICRICQIKNHSNNLFQVQE